ncbi:hypothetical protein ARMGADRAFT_1048266 [Armillaria gallica]|uniref:Uncharacterized protein n=1 Tax=Armillaria gallica TaxID=47427 RepID=A0A2H3DA26_ARMGA|nr:hypothetical protein ARMGADRAFT_1048266 [Armillaria gallica]
MSDQDSWLVEASRIPDKLKGYIWITGRNDNQGLPVKQGVLLPYRSVWGCIGPDIAVLSLVIMKQGYASCLGLKWATNIHKMFNWSKEDDVHKYVVCREVKSGKKENVKSYTKAPNIQCLVTLIRFQSCCHFRSVKHRKLEHQKEQKCECDALTAKRVSEKKAKVAAIKAPHHKDNHY